MSERARFVAVPQDGDPEHGDPWGGRMWFLLDTVTGRALNIGREARARAAAEWGNAHVEQAVSEGEEHALGAPGVCSNHTATNRTLAARRAPAPSEDDDEESDDDE